MTTLITAAKETKKPLLSVCRGKGKKCEWFCVARPMSPGRIIVVLCYTKYIVFRSFKPRILELSIKRGQSNFSIRHYVYFC